jgi:hypothetical protein
VSMDGWKRQRTPPAPGSQEEWARHFVGELLGLERMHAARNRAAAEARRVAGIRSHRAEYDEYGEKLDRLVRERGFDTDRYPFKPLKPGVAETFRRVRVAERLGLAVPTTNQMIPPPDA